MRKLLAWILMLSLVEAASCRKVENIELGKNYRIHNERGPRNRVIVGQNDIVKVKDHVVNYAYDSLFIAAAQLPWDSVPGIWNMTYNEKNHALDTCTFRQYWIIDKRDDKIYGPMRLASFKTVCDSLRVDTSLRKKIVNISEVSDPPFR